MFEHRQLYDLSRATDDQTFTSDTQCHTFDVFHTYTPLASAPTPPQNMGGPVEKIIGQFGAKSVNLLLQKEKEIVP